MFCNFLKVTGCVRGNCAISAMKNQSAAIGDNGLWNVKV
jgi:hypothetical protein